MFLDVEYARFIPKGPGVGNSERAPATAVLSIPRLSAGIPIEYQQPPHPSMLLLVRQLYRAGIITADDLAPEVSITALLESVLKRTVKDTLGKTELTGFGIGLSDSEDGWYCVDGRIDDHIDEDKMPTDDEQARLFMSVHNQPMVFVGKNLESLEAFEPGLGQTIYAVLEHAAWGGFGIFTINHVINDIGFLYGLEDGIDPEEEGDAPHEGTPEDDDEDGPITVDLLKRNLPAWAGDAKLLLTPAQCLEVAQRADVPEWVSHVVNAAITAANAWKDGHGHLGFVDRYEQEPFHRQATVRFFEEDNIGRAIDDYEHMANQCSDSYIDLVHLMRVDLRDTEKVRKWWQGIENGCKLLHAVDQLLSVLSDK